MTNSQIWGFRILRIGMALVFFWFGFQQLSNPDAWTGVVPDFFGQLPFITANKIVLLNGLFEILASILLILNLFTRLISILLAVHLFFITLTFGLSPIGVRDFGLTIATLSIFFLKSKN